MWERLRKTCGFRRRDLLAVLALVSHLLATFGFPLPAPSRNKPTGDTPYPCQSRPCGCLTPERCWAGDCCCFTLEEKITWAEANGVEPPDHVRPLVESRRPRPTPPKEKSCCTESEPAAEPSAIAAPTCCEKRKPAATCCHEPPPREAAPDTEGIRCAAKSEPDCCVRTPPTADQYGVRWVVGVFALKCRGEGPTGLFQLDPAVVPDLTPTHLPEPERGDRVAPRSDRTTSLAHSPPTRPPRAS